MTREGGLILTYKIEEPQQQFFPPAISSTPTSSRPFLSVRALFRRPRTLCPVHFCVRTGPHRVPGPMDPLCLYSVASCRRMSNQRPRAAERPSADDDETVEDLVPRRGGCGQQISGLTVGPAVCRPRFEKPVGVGL